MPKHNALRPFFRGINNGMARVLPQLSQHPVNGLEKLKRKMNRTTRDGQVRVIIYLFPFL